MGFEQTKTPVMVSEVILMTKEEACPLRPSLKKCATRLTVAQLAHDRGVSDSVIDLHATEWRTGILGKCGGDHFW